MGSGDSEMRGKERKSDGRASGENGSAEGRGAAAAEEARTAERPAVS